MSHAAALFQNVVTPGNDDVIGFFSAASVQPGQNAFQFRQKRGNDGCGIKLKGVVKYLGGVLSLFNCETHPVSCLGM